MTVEAFFLEDGPTRLYTVLHLPDETAEVSGGVILCHPLFEEHKASRRFFVELSKSLVSKRLCVAFMDLTGCGDSEGDFADFSITDWLEDLSRLKRHIAERFKDRPLSFHLLGARFGATLACLRAENAADIQSLVLIDPILNGSDYLTEILKRKLVREMMTSGGGEASVKTLTEGLTQGLTIDVDGFAVGQRFSAPVSKVDCRSLKLPKGMKILLVQQAAQKKLTPEFQTFLNAHDQGRSASSACLQTPPFWKAVDVADHQLLLSTVLKWKF